METQNKMTGKPATDGIGVTEMREAVKQSIGICPLVRKEVEISKNGIFYIERFLNGKWDCILLTSGEVRELRDFLNRNLKEN